MNAINPLITRLKCFSKDESGATAIEYGLFAALIGAVIVGTVVTLGGQTNAGFTTVSSELTSAGITAPTN
jgi:pilus assembly protein Flp/PilA